MYEFFLNPSVLDISLTIYMLFVLIVVLVLKVRKLEKENKKNVGTILYLHDRISKLESDKAWLDE